ncbi:uncharacterized protein LOC125952018 [Anopheles darlingi]|uniref:uncharacterized protein LOC125952018 n=1 Tax=Anopheles darlingi TaxID=43151 RepID=UPI0021001410|nr:uncharacterized protein LOC125952018 [Anopheles darlingi]
MLLAVRCVIGTVNIHDLHSNPLVVVSLGKAKITMGHVRILHPIELAGIGRAINGVNEQVTRYQLECRKNTPPCPALGVIVHRCAALQDTFRKIMPSYSRQKRWDTIGTVWKWIAGTPDAEDLKTINSSMNSLIKENNRQVFINEKMNEKLAILTNMTKTILSINKPDPLYTTILISNINALQSLVENLQEAIILAKHGIPSSKLLSMRDYEAMTMFLQQHAITVSSFEEMLSEANVKVAMNRTHVTYMTIVPKQSAKPFDYLYIESVTRNKTRISITNHNILRNETHVLQSNRPCLEGNNNFICESAQLEAANECISKLVQGKHASCTFEHVYSSRKIKQTSRDILLISDSLVELSASCNNNTQILKGSFLIQYHDCKLVIDGEEFENYDSIQSTNHYSPLTGLLVNVEQILDKPELEHLQSLAIEHRKTLKTLTLQNNSLSFKLNVFSSLGSAAILACGIALCTLFLRCNRISVKMTEAAKTSTSTETPPETSDKRRKELETYLDTPTPLRQL